VCALRADVPVLERKACGGLNLAVHAPTKGELDFVCSPVSWPVLFYLPDNSQPEESFGDPSSVE